MGSWSIASLRCKLALWAEATICFSPLPPGGLCWALGSCAWAASRHLREGRLGALPGAEEELPRDCAQAFLFSQKFQPFKDQGPERGAFSRLPGSCFSSLAVSLGLVEASLILSGFLERCRAPGGAGCPLATSDKTQAPAPPTRPLGRNYFLNQLY